VEGPLTPLPLRWLWTGSGSQSDQRAGAPVYKTCERCSGNGFSTMPSTAAYKAILTLIPDCTSEHGPVTGNPSVMRWWTYAGRKSAMLIRNFKKRPIFKTMATIFCFFGA
jgi:hypothetical protein